ncbi:hypothetical protein FB45DRAFT_907472 [Roridomyces roridus]|uniref:MYND-type domain-containing protein n=1 Tax=Roridomyces roridus TaxID=1738132 RepID=A0AAD7C2E6_9AGAR|nr:hypothetical protein FB45DRAFT_907472 [Roridomyces roridus]
MGDAELGNFWHCGLKDGNLRCTGCRKDAYCSNECQLASWEQCHKQLCRGKTTNKPLKPMSPLDPPIVRLSLEEERARTGGDTGGLHSKGMRTFNIQALRSRGPENYVAIPNPPILELVSAEERPPEFTHATTELLCEFLIMNGQRIITAQSYQHPVISSPPTRERAISVLHTRMSIHHTKCLKSCAVARRQDWKILLWSSSSRIH